MQAFSSVSIRAILLVLTIVFITGRSFSQSEFYDISTIQDIKLTFFQSNWDAKLDSLKAANEEAYLLAKSVEINGEIFDSVGVKYKGNSSYKASNAKNPMHIELDYIRADQNYKGLKDIKLGNGFSDPTFVREALSYEILRQYMDAPMANFAKLTINGQAWGLYSNQQSINKSFIRDHFITNGDNPFIKGNPQSLGGPPGSGGLPDLVYSSTDSSAYYARYEMKSDYGWRELLALMDTLKNHPGSIDKILDIDRTLWMLAFNVVLVNLDSYTGAFAQNYYLYYDENGRFIPIVWDLNMSFGNFPNLSSGMGGGSLSLTQMQNLDPLTQSSNASRPLIKVLLSNATYKRMYLAHIRTMLKENFADDHYRTRALAIQAIIDTEVQADTKKFYTYAQFLSNVDQTIAGFFLSPGLTTLMDARYDYLVANANLSPAPPVLANPVWSPAVPISGTSVWVTASVQNASTVWIGIRENTGDVFVRYQLFDDGQHQDGAAGDGTYGAALTAGKAKLQYYLFAEHAQAGAFLPERAEFEYFTLASSIPLPQAGAVVLNEFLADNENGAADENNELEDWVELFNRSNQDQPLFGLYLSDDPNKADKWAFPESAVLPAGGFLVVWLDEDGDQGDLHANFKLSKSGEFLMLSDGISLVYDSLSFGTQQSDISFGRYPNGTGPFQAMPVTFDTYNTTTGTSSADTSGRGIRLSPNPASQSVRIDSPTEIGRIQLFNALGALCAEQVLEGTSGSISVASLPAGMYWVKAGIQDARKLIIR